MIEAERAKSALDFLDPGCSRDEWVKIGMAAKAAMLDFDHFHEWSRGGENYRGESDCRAVWNSIKAGPVTEKTLFKIAHDAGWVAPFPHACNGAPARVNNLCSMNGNPVHTTASKPPERFAKRETDPNDLWEQCEPATPLHGYILRKKGLPHGLRVYPQAAPPLVIRNQDIAGYLVVPCYGHEGKVQTLQFIPPDKGGKLNLYGASFGNGYFIVGDIAASRRVFVVEGLGQAWSCYQATGDAAIVAFGAGRMEKVATELRRQFSGIRLVIVPDRGKESQAQAIAMTIDAEWCELPSDMPLNYDVNDFMQKHDGEALEALLERSKAPPLKFRVLTAAVLAALPPMRWRVHNVLPEKGLAGLFGPSTSGKTFLAFDLAAATAGGDSNWFGYKVTPCPVAYICLEGEAGLSNRVQAWEQHHQQHLPKSLLCFAQPFDLLDDDDVIQLAKAIQVVGGANGVVIIDTMNRATPGADENSSSDMGRTLAASKRLQGLLDALVVLVHHTGKDASRGMRGHSSLFAALDAAIEVSRNGDRREWRVAKAKDGRDGQVHPFRLEVVTVGLDEEGEAITSCVVVPDESAVAVKKAKIPSGSNQKIAVDALAEPLRASSEFGKGDAPPNHPCIRLDEAVIKIAESLLHIGPKHKKERAQDALASLVKMGIYGVKDGWLWRK